MNKVVLFLILFLFTFPTKAEVIIKVHDGDTVTTNSGEKIRLACIDAPEITKNKHGNKDLLNGIPSRNWLANLILNKDIKIERIKKDLYGRTIAKLYLPNGTEINHLSVLEKHSIIYMAKTCSWANNK